MNGGSAGFLATGLSKVALKNLRYDFHATKRAVLGDLSVCLVSKDWSCMLTKAYLLL